MHHVYVSGKVPSPRPPLPLVPIKPEIQYLNFNPGGEKFRAKKSLKKLIIEHQMPNSFLGPRPPILVLVLHSWAFILEEGRVTYSSILAWRIPWTEEPGRLQSMGSQRVVHNWSDLAHIHVKAFIQIPKEELDKYLLNQWLTQYFRNLFTFHKTLSIIM